MICALRFPTLAMAALAWGSALLAGAPADRDVVLKVAREKMTTQRYCALATLDGSGRPTVRTMSPIAPEADMAVYFATHDQSRKVQEIRKDSRVTLYYADHGKVEGYVAVQGRASLVSDPAEIQKRKRAYWDQAFPGMKHLVLIRVVPERIEVLSYKDQLVVDPATGATPSVEFPVPAR